MGKYDITYISRSSDQNISLFRLYYGVIGSTNIKFKRVLYYLLSLYVFIGIEILGLPGDVTPYLFNLWGVVRSCHRRGVPSMWNIKFAV